MNQTEIVPNATGYVFDELAEARSHFRMEAALETFEAASRAAATNPLCPHCISPYGQWRGYRTRAKTGEVVHRRRCNPCGHWYTKTTTR